MTAPAEPPKKRSWTGLIKYVIGVALLVFVIWSNWADKTEVDKVTGEAVTVPGLGSLLQTAPNWGAFALCGLLCAGVVSSQYVRWFVLVRALDLPFTLRNAFRLGMVGTFYNTFLPGAIGGDLVKAFFIAKGQPDRKAAAVSTVVADRALGLFGLLVFGGFVGGAMWLSGNEKIAGNGTLQGIVIGSAIAAAVVAFGYLGLGWVKPAAAERIDAKLKGVKKVGPTLAELFETGLRFRRRPRAILAGVGLSAVGHLLMMLLFDQAVRVFSVGEVGTFAEHIVIAPIGFIVQAVIPLPGGLGVAEFSFGGLYEIIRKGGKVVGLTGRLALRVIEWCLGGICYVVYLSMKAELPAPPTKAEGAAGLDPVEK